MVHIDKKWFDEMLTAVEEFDTALHAAEHLSDLKASWKAAFLALREVEDRAIVQWDEEPDDEVGDENSWENVMERLRASPRNVRAEEPTIEQFREDSRPFGPGTMLPRQYTMPPVETILYIHDETQMEKNVDDDMLLKHTILDAKSAPKPAYQGEIDQLLLEIKRDPQAIKDYIAAYPQGVTGHYPPADNMDRAYTFLYRLQRSGLINMMASPPVLARVLGMDSEEALNKFKAWTVDWNQADYDRCWSFAALNAVALGIQGE